MLEGLSGKNTDKEGKAVEGRQRSGVFISLGITLLTMNLASNCTCIFKKRQVGSHQRQVAFFSICIKMQIGVGGLQEMDHSNKT